MPLANGFEDVEAMAVVDVLRRAGISIDIVGVPSTFLTSEFGVRLTADKKFTDINVDDYDGLVLAGGEENVNALSNYLPLLAAIERFNRKKKLLAAICSAPLILAKVGVLQERRATVHPGRGLEKSLPYPRGDRVVVDGHVITSQGPGTAIEFALKIVEVLAGKGKASAVKSSMVA